MDLTATNEKGQEIMGDSDCAHNEELCASGKHPEPAPRLRPEPGGLVRRVLEVDEELRRAAAGRPGATEGACWGLLEAHQGWALPLCQADNCTGLLSWTAARWIHERCRTRSAQMTYASSFRGLVLGLGIAARLAHVRRLGTAALRNFLLDEAAHTRSERSVLHRLQVARSWFSWLIEQGLLDATEHPVKRDLIRLCRVDAGAMALKPGGQRQALEPAEAKAVAAAALQLDLRCRLVVLLPLVAGCRISEALGLRRRDVLEIGGRVRLAIAGKGKRTRVQDVEPWLGRLILARLAEENPPADYLVEDSNFLPMNRFTAYRIITELIEKVTGRTGLSPHDLRRTCASLLRLNGATDDQVQRHLGHSDVRTTLNCYALYGRDMKATTGLEVSC